MEIWRTCMAGIESMPVPCAKRPDQSQSRSLALDRKLGDSRSQKRNGMPPRSQRHIRRISTTCGATSILGPIPFELPLLETTEMVSDSYDAVTVADRRRASSCET